MVYDLKDERTVLRRGKRIRKGEGKQEALETKQIEILENTPTVAHGTTLRRDREKKVHFELDQNKTSENIPFQANGNLLRRGRKKEVSLTSQVVSSTSLRKKYNLLEIDAKKETPKKDKAAASEYTVSSTKENPVRRGRRKQVDDKVLATSSTFFGGKCSLLEYSGKEEVSKDHSVPLETMVLHTKEKLSRRGKRNEVFLTARGASLRGESSLPEHDGKEDIPEEDQNVLLGNTAETKATPSRKSRRKQVALTTQATGCTSLREKSSLPENDKEVIPKEQNMSLGSTTSQEKANLSRNSRRKQVDLTAQGASSTSLRGKSRLLENNGKEEIPEDDQNVLLGNTAKTKATQSRKSQRKQVDLTTQETSCPSLRGKRSLPENDDKEEIPKDQNMSLGSTASQEKTNPSRNSRRKQVGLIAQGASSTSLRGKSSLPENDGKEDIPEEDQNVLLGNTAEIKATPSRKSRRKQVDLTTQATSCTSHRGKSSLPENDDKGKVPAEDQNVPFKNITKTQANPSRKGRRKQVDLTTQATSCTSLRGESSLPENYGKEDIPEEDQNVFLGNTAEAKATPSRKSRRKQVDLTTQATSCTSPRGKNCLPEKNDKEKTLKDENVSFRNATETKANPFSKGRRKQAGLTTQAASCTSLKGKSLPEKEGKEKTPKENQNMPLGNITSQASKKGGRKQLDLTTQAASPTAIEGKSCMPKNDSKKKTSEEDQNVPLANTTLETKANPSRKGRGKQVELTSQAASSTSLRRKRHLPEDEETAKKLKAECGERITLQKETRNKSNRKLDKCGLNIQSVGGTERKTRASTRTRK
nr:uncharacterized protein LOC102452706 isoform X1 [Pelodiscus sinensis]|eukprot:XP_006136713.1 uncharacterized protein LOC102452706 isoform X1 [Pelodiscus sinensis]